MNNVEWLKDYGDLVKAANDEPKFLEELQQGVGKHRPGLRRPSYRRADVGRTVSASRAAR